MELHWSHASSGKHGAAGEGFSVRDSRTITQTLDRNPDEDFECTYFRQRTTRIPPKEKKSGGLFPVTICYTLPTELSDGYTDSDSESDNTSNVERWLESLPANDAWSSVPNYSALDGSEGVEGVDEIQEDTKKSLEDDSGTCLNGSNDSRRSFAPETGDSKVRVTGSDFAKPSSAKQDGVFVVEERHDRKVPHQIIKRTLKTRQKIPRWTKMEREAKTVTEKEKSSKKKPNGKHFGVPERNISIDEKAVWSMRSILETTESRTTIKKSYAEEDGYDKMMQEMVNRLLTVSAYREDQSTSEQVIETDPKIESFSKMNSYRDSKELFDSRKSKETVDTSITSLGMKRARLSSRTLKKFSPRLAQKKMNENELPKRKKNAMKIKTLTQNPKSLRKVSQEKKPSVTKDQFIPVQKPRYAVTNQPFVGNVGPGKRKSQLRTVRFQDEVTTRTSSESWRQTAMAKAARNKQILQTVEQIVDGIQSGKSHYGKEDICAGLREVKKVSKNSICELEPGDAVQLKTCESWWSNRKRPMHSIENKTIGSKKPMFTNPFVENCLDKAMDSALSKYKRPQNTWADFNKEKLRENGSSAAYEPPAKKRKPKSFTCKLENMQRQDFSLFNSWQSIHNYFLSYSSCK